jgi:hypothetical protein
LAWVPESVFEIKRFVFCLLKMAPVLSNFFKNALCILSVLVLGSGINHTISILDPKFRVRKPVPVLLAAVRRGKKNFFCEPVPDPGVGRPEPVPVSVSA